MIYKLLLIVAFFFLFHVKSATFADIFSFYVDISSQDQNQLNSIFIKQDDLFLLLSDNNNNNMDSISHSKCSMKLSPYNQVNSYTWRYVSDDQTIITNQHIIQHWTSFSFFYLHHTILC